ncbi:hypothetical protein AB0E62_01530 [Streptomyces sp. NPDC038707]|uniref:hypothetical protein n=1 Tax=Streptomyces sp. NPDC038707 TaxID=3154329 RepID=UPI0033E4B256
MFHGCRWRAAHRYGSFDAALTPVDGPAPCFPHRTPPRLLGAGAVLPVHYGGWHPGPGEPSRLRDAAASEPCAVLTPAPGEDLTL